MSRVTAGDFQPRVRVDAWVWAVRLFPTRTAAANACKAGHIKVNSVRVKPAQLIGPGDTVRALTPGGERIVIVVRTIQKRVGADAAAQCYDDRTPPPPPKEEAPADIVRERGTGRPTKKERRETDRLRGRGTEGR